MAEFGVSCAVLILQIQPVWVKKWLTKCLRKEKLPIWRVSTGKLLFRCRLCPMKLGKSWIAAKLSTKLRIWSILENLLPQNDYTTHVIFHFFRNFPLILRHFDRAAKTYEQNSSLQFETSLMAIDWLRQFFKKDNRSSWLELGCATGKLAALISDQSLANNVDAVDLSGEMIAFAKKNHFRK